MAAADDDHVPALGRQLLDRGGKPDLPQLGRDLVHGVRTSWSASASTATAPCARTITGLSSISASGSSASLVASVATASGASTPSVCSAVVHARARDRQRDDRDRVQQLGVDAAEADDEHRHDAVAPDRDQQLDAGRGHPLDEHGAAEPAVGLLDRDLVVDVEDQPAVDGLVAQPGALERDRAAELAPGGDRGVLVGDASSRGRRGSRRRAAAPSPRAPRARRRGRPGARAPISAIRSGSGVVASALAASSALRSPAIPPGGQSSGSVEASSDVASRPHRGSARGPSNSSNRTSTCPTAGSSPSAAISSRSASVSSHSSDV